MSEKLTQLPDQMPEQPPIHEGDDYGVVGAETNDLNNIDSENTPPYKEIDTSSEEDGIDTEEDSDSFENTSGTGGVVLRGIKRASSKVHTARKTRRDFRIRKKALGIKKSRGEKPLEYTKEQRTDLEDIAEAMTDMEKLDRKMALYGDLASLIIKKVAVRTDTRSGRPIKPKFGEKLRIWGAKRKVSFLKNARKELRDAEKQYLPKKILRNGGLKYRKAVIKERLAEKLVDRSVLGSRKMEKMKNKYIEALSDLEMLNQNINMDDHIQDLDLDQENRGDHDSLWDDGPVTETGRELPFRVVKPIRIDSDEDGAPRVEIPKVKLPDEAEVGDGSDKPEEETSTEEDVRAKSEAEKINEQDLKKGDIITTDKFGEESEWTVHSYNESTDKILITRPANDGSGTRVGKYVTIDQITGRKSKASGPKAKKQPTDLADSYEKLQNIAPNA